MFPGTKEFRPLVAVGGNERGAARRTPWEIAMKRPKIDDVGASPELELEARPTAGSTDVEAETRAEDRRRMSAEVRRKYDFSVIRMLRHQKGLTIEKFAKACGISYAPISRIETNLIKPNLDTLDRIAEGLGIPTHRLLALAEKREAQLGKAVERRLGGFTFKSVAFEGVEILVGGGKRGSMSADIDARSTNVTSILVRVGTIDVKMGDKSIRVPTGESLHFETGFPHRIEAVEDCDIVLVTHPVV